MNVKEEEKLNSVEEKCSLGKEEKTEIPFKGDDGKDTYSEGEMPCSNPNGKRSSSDTDLDTKISIEEAHFKKLFNDVNEEIRNKYRYDGGLVKETITQIKKSFLTYSMDDLDFNSTIYSYCYFIRYATLNAAVSRDRILNAMNNCEKLKSRLKQSKLNIISLGGGPGTDMVGFCSAFQECREKSNKSLDFCVVDKWNNWKSFYDVIKNLLRENDYGNASRVFQDQESKISTSFMEVDIFDSDPPSKYISAVSKADIVLLVRVLDSFDYKLVDTEVLFQSIVKRMREDALLIFVDCCVYRYSSQNLRRIYFPDLETFVLKNMDEVTEWEASETNAKIAVFVKK